MKILNASQIREADQFSIQQEGISSDALMERAAGKCFDWIFSRFGTSKPFRILCGNGNNGGDGLVIARLLFLADADVEVWLCEGKTRSSENSLNLERLEKLKVRIQTLDADHLPEDLPKESIMIDALLGSGLRLPLSAEMENIIRGINRMKRTLMSVISIDTPSGFDADHPQEEPVIAIMADFTLCFQCPRLMFYFSESEKFTGQWEVLDIGLKIPEEFRTEFNYLLKNELYRIIPPRSTFSHKGSFGHVFIAGGSSGRCGAMTMAAEACLRSGAGLVTAMLPADCSLPFQSACKEAMTYVSGSGTHLEPAPIKATQFSVLAFGPGAGVHEETSKLLKYLIQESLGPMVIDADGINILAENKTWLAFIPPYSILTPHLGEFDRLAGKSDNSIERLERAREISRKYALIIVLKDAYTRIVLPDGRVFFNSTGNPGMATAGSGDVLTGIISGLLAQGLTPEDAAKCGVFIHGLAGDIAGEQYTMQGMIARDIISSLPQAWKVFQS